MSLPNDVAAAIAAELNAANSFVLDFQAERSYADWQLVLQDANELRVDVVPLSAKLRDETRGSWEYTVAVNVCIRFRFDPQFQDDETGRMRIEEIDRLADLTQQIGEFFMPCQTSQDGRALSDLEEAVLDTTAPDGGVEFPVIGSAEHLQQHRMFLSIVRLTYRVPTGPS